MSWKRNVGRTPEGKREMARHKRVLLAIGALRNHWDMDRRQIDLYYKFEAKVHASNLLRVPVPADMIIRDAIRQDRKSHAYIKSHLTR